MEEHHFVYSSWQDLDSLLMWKLLSYLGGLMVQMLGNKILQSSYIKKNDYAWLLIIINHSGDLEGQLVVTELSMNS